MLDAAGQVGLLGQQRAVEHRDAASAAARRRTRSPCRPGCRRCWPASRALFDGQQRLLELEQRLGGDLHVGPAGMRMKKTSVLVVGQAEEAALDHVLVVGLPGEARAAAPGAARSATRGAGAKLHDAARQRLAACPGRARPRRGRSRRAARRISISFGPSGVRLHQATAQVWLSTTGIQPKATKTEATIAVADRDRQRHVVERQPAARGR